MTTGDTNSKYSRQTILEVRNWPSPGLCSVRLTRPAGFSFLPGQFARIGLPDTPSSDTPTLWRAYSMVTHPREDVLEFLSVTVPQGQFSPRMAALQPGDSIWVENTPFGFLTLDRFVDGETLWLICTGTGLSAYIPMLRDDLTWDRFKKIILVHGVRTQDELAYRDEMMALMARYNVGDDKRLVYLAATSRQDWPASSPDGVAPGVTAQRIPTALMNTTLESVAGKTLDPTTDRVMLCGNPEMVTVMRKHLAERGFAAGRRGIPGNLAVENYW